METTLRALNWVLFVAWWLAVCWSLVDSRPNWWFLPLILPAWVTWRWFRLLRRRAMDDPEEYLRRERACRVGRDWD